MLESCSGGEYSSEACRFPEHIFQSHIVISGLRSAIFLRPCGMIFAPFCFIGICDVCVTPRQTITKILIFICESCSRSPVHARGQVSIHMLWELEAFAFFLSSGYDSSDSASSDWNWASKAFRHGGNRWSPPSLLSTILLDPAPHHLGLSKNN